MKKPNKKPRKKAEARPKAGRSRARSKKKRFVIGNWKMNPQSLDEAKATFRKIRRTAHELKNTNVVICPPFVYLSEIAKLSDGSVRPGAQDIYWEESGSYTGEVSATQARDAGAEYAIVGHSERRAMGETDVQVGKKAVAAIVSGMTAIICVGELARDVESGQHLQFLEDQIKNTFASISRKDFTNVILAYEPVWAIGKSDDEAMTGKDLYEMSLYIKKVLMGIYGKDLAFSVPILYGGSVTFKNTLDIVKEGQVDGLLVGRQSLEADGFAEVLRIVDSL